MAVKETVELKVIVTPELSRLTSLEQKINQPHNINVGLNIAEAEKGWSKLQGRLNTAITPKINETQLYSLNQHIDLKLRHWAQLKNALEKGVAPKLDLSAFSNIPTIYVPVVADTTKYKRDIKNLTADGDVIGAINGSLTFNSAQLSNTIERAIRNSQKQRTDVGSIAKTIAYAPIRAVTNTVSGLATAPFKIAGDVIGNTATVVLRGAGESVGKSIATPISDYLRNQSLATARKINDIATNTFNDKSLAIFVGEMMNSGNVVNATSAAAEYGGASENLKVINQFLRQSTKVIDSIQKLSEVNKDIETLTALATTPVGSFTTSIKETSPRVYDELEKIVNEARQQKGKDPISLDMAGRREVLVAAKTLETKARKVPVEVMQTIVEPALSRFGETIGKFVGTIQAYRTAMAAQSNAIQQLADGVQIATEDATGMVQVIGGAQFAQGEGGAQVAARLESLLKGASVVPVKNPDTDNVAISNLTQSPVYRLIEKLATNMGVLTGNKNTDNTAMNAIRQIAVALDPGFISSAAEEAVTNALVARSQGIDESNQAITSYSLGGAELIRVARTLDLLGINIKQLAQAYPASGLTGEDYGGNFQSTILKGDPLNFPYDIGAVNPPKFQTRLDSRVQGMEAHADKHLYKVQEFLEIFYSTFQGVADLDYDSLVKASDSIATFQHNIGSSLYELLGSMEQAKSLLNTGEFNLDSPIRAFSPSGDISSVDILSRVFESYDKIEKTKGKGTSEQQALAERLLQGISPIIEKAKEVFASVGIAQDASAKELFSVVKFLQQATQRNLEIKSFLGENLSTEESSKAYFAAADADQSQRSTVLTSRLADARAGLSYFSNMADSMGDYGDKIVKVYKTIISAMQEMAETGSISDELRLNLEEVRLDDSILNDSISSLLSGSLDTLSLPSFQDKGLPKGSSPINYVLGETIASTDALATALEHLGGVSEDVRDILDSTLGKIVSGKINRSPLTDENDVSKKFSELSLKDWTTVAKEDIASVLYEIQNIGNEFNNQLEVARPFFRLSFNSWKALIDLASELSDTILPAIPGGETTKKLAKNVGVPVAIAGAVSMLSPEAYAALHSAATALTEAGLSSAELLLRFQTAVGEAVPALQPFTALGENALKLAGWLSKIPGAGGVGQGLLEGAGVVGAGALAKKGIKDTVGAVTPKVIKEEAERASLSPVMRQMYDQQKALDSAGDSYRLTLEQYDEIKPKFTAANREVRSLLDKAETYMESGMKDLALTLVTKAREIQEKLNESFFSPTFAVPERKRSIAAFRGNSAAQLERISQMESSLEGAAVLPPIDVSAGENIAKGAIEGVESKANEFTDAVSKLSEEGQQAFRKDNEIQSPSRVYARYGGMLVEGAAKGVVESIPSITSAIDKLNDAAQDTVDLQGGKGGIHLELSQALEGDSIAPAIDRIKELVGKISGIGDALKDIPFHSTPMANLNHKGMFRRDTAEIHLNAARHVGSKYGIETESLLGTIAHELRHAAQLYAESNKIAMRYLTPQRGDKDYVEAGIAASTASKQHLPPAILNAARKREEDAYTFELQFNRMFSNLVDSVAVRKDNPEEAAHILKTLKVIAHTDRKGLKEEQFPIVNINLIKEFKAVGSASREFAKDFQHLLSVLNSYHPNKAQGKALSDSAAYQTTPSIAEDVMAGFSDASYDPSWVTPYTTFVDKVKDVFGIASPSKVFAGIRKDINDGFASGSLELGSEEILHLSKLLTELESKAKNVNMDSSELEDYIAKSRELASILKNVGLSSSAKTLEEYNPQAEIGTTSNTSKEATKRGMDYSHFFARGVILGANRSSSGVYGAIANMLDVDFTGVGSQIENQLQETLNKIQKLTPKDRVFALEGLGESFNSEIESIRELATTLAEADDVEGLKAINKELAAMGVAYSRLRAEARRAGTSIPDTLTPLRKDITGEIADARGRQFATNLPSKESAAIAGAEAANVLEDASNYAQILGENLLALKAPFAQVKDIAVAFGGPVMEQIFGSLGSVVERFGVLKMGGTTAFLAIALGVGAYTAAQAGLAQELKSLSLQFRALGYDGEQSVERMFRLSQKTGTSFRQTAKLGAGIAGSLQFTGIEDQTVKLTEQIVKVNTALQLGADESQRFETALVQMLSKGVVSMEEVRQQAAEAVPSFFPALARGLDMTPAEAMKAISAGEVSSAEAVPAALEELTKMSEASYEEGLRSLPASLNRISNSMLEINATFGAAPLGAMSTVSRIFANILEAATPLIKFLAPLASAFVLLGTGVAMKLVLGMTAVSGTMALVGKGVKLWATTTMTAANSVLASMTAMVTKITGLQGVAAGLATGGLIVGITAAVVAIGGLIHHLKNYHKEYDTLIDIMNNTEVNPHLDTALGEDVTGGLSQGVTKGASDYIESIRKTAREGDRAFREENQIQSPSKKMARYGTDLTKGLVQGIRAGQPEVDKTLRELTQESLAMPIFEPKSSNPFHEGSDIIPQSINKVYVGTLEKQIKVLEDLIDGDAFLSELRIKVAYGDVDTAKLSLIEMNKELRKLKAEGGPLNTFGKNESIDKQFGERAQVAKKRVGDIVSQTLSLTPEQIDNYARGRRDIEAELNNIEAAIALESSKATPNDSIIDRLNSQANLAKDALAAFDAGLTESGGLATLEAIEAQLESMIKTAEGRGDVELAVSLSNDLAPVKKAINRIKRFTEQNPILIQLTVAEGKFKDAEDALLVNYNETRAKLLKQRASFAITEEQLGLKEAQVDKINADEKIKNLNNYIQERSDILKKAPGSATLAATLGISAEDFDASGFETASMEKLYGLIQDIEKGAPGAEKYANTLDAIKELRQGIVDLSGARLDAAEATRREVQANVTYLASLRDVLGVILRVNAARESMNFTLEANQTQARIDLARRRVGGEIGGSEYDLENARLSMEQLAQKIDNNSAHMANLSDAIGRLTEEEKAQAAELIGNDIEGASYGELKDFLARKEQASALGQPLGNANIDEAVRARITQFEVGNENLQLEEQQIEAARAQLVEVTASQLRQYRQSIRNFNQSVEDYIQQMNDQLEDTVAEIANLQSQTNLISQRNALREHLLGATQSIDKEFFELIINAVSGISDILNTQEIRQNARAIRDLTKQNTRTIQSTMDELASIQEQRYEMAGARQPGTVSLGNRLENTGEERLELLDKALQNTGTDLTSGLQGSTQKILNASNNFGGALESGATVLQRSQALAYEKLKQMGAQDYDGWQSAPGVYNASASKLAQQQGMADLRAEYGAISSNPQKSGLDVLRAASIYSSFGGSTKEEQDRALNDFKAQVGDFFDQEFSGEGFNKIGDVINTETNQLTGDMNAAFEKTMAALNDKSVALANLNREKIAEILLGAKEGFDALTRRLPETILQLKQNLRQLDNSIADFALSNAVVLTPQQRQAQQERQRVDTFEGLKLTLEQTKNSLIDAGALLGQDANAETIDRLYATVDSIAAQGSTPQEQAIAKDSSARLRELVDAFAQNGDRLELQASLQEWLGSLTAKQNDLLAANNQALMNNTEANRQQRNTQRANIAQSLGGALTDTANTLNISQIDKDYLGAQATYNIALASQAREMDELRNQLKEAGLYSDELFGSMKKLSDLKLERLKDDVRVIESTIRDTLKSGLEGGLNTALDDLLNEGKLDFGKLALDFGKSIIKGIAQPGIDVLSTGLSNVLTTGKWKGNSGVDDALKGGLGSLKNFSSGLSPQIMTVKAGVVNIEGGNALDALGGIINKGEATGSIGEAIDKGVSIKDAFNSSSLGSMIPNIGGVEDSPLGAAAASLGGLSTTLTDAASGLDSNLTDFSEKTGSALGESAGAIGGAVASIPGIIKSFQSGDVGGGILGIVSAALPLIGAFADGGSVGLGAMLTAERAMSGKNPLLAVVHEGEEILTTKNDDAATFRGLKQSGAWDLIKDHTKNYATGGTVGKMDAAAAAVWNGRSRVSNSTSTNNTSIVVQGVSNTQEFARSQTQLANRQELRQRQASRRMTNK